MLRTCLFVLACSLSLPAVLAGTNAFGKKFLEENKARAGVTTLPSGLQYRVLRDGDGEWGRGRVGVFALYLVLAYLVLAYYLVLASRRVG